MLVDQEHVTELPIQPIACVIGHPIAGNPMQFAIERAFAAAELDWRFLSLDVVPQRFAEAFGGIDALGFQGAMIAAPYARVVADRLAHLDAVAERSHWVDCVTRDSTGQLRGHQLLGRVLAAVVDFETLTAGRDAPMTAVLVGEDPATTAACHAILGGPIGQWILTDLEPAALQPAFRPVGPAADAPAGEEATAPTNEHAPPSQHLAASPPAPAAPVRAPAASDPDEPGDLDAAEPAPGENQMLPTQASARSSQDTANEASGEAVQETQQRAPLPTASDRSPPAIRRDSLDEAISDEAVLIIRGARADGQPASIPEALLDRLEAPALIVDMATAASTSTLARAAAERGLQGITRLDLLIARTALAIKLWTGETIDPEILREAFEEYLEI